MILTGKYFDLFIDHYQHLVITYLKRVNKKSKESDSKNSVVWSPL